MTIGEFKKYIKDNNLKDEMPMGILDTSTDDFDDCNYPVKEDTLVVEDYVDAVDREVIGKALYLTFENVLNENPI